MQVGLGLIPIAAKTNTSSLLLTIVCYFQCPSSSIVCCPPLTVIPHCPSFLIICHSPLFVIGYCMSFPIAHSFLLSAIPYCLALAIVYHSPLSITSHSVIPHCSHAPLSIISYILPVPIVWH